jgi:hypothetical protein
MSDTLAAESLDGWIPIAIAWGESGPTVDWVRLGDIRFEDPFFADTMTRCLERPFNRVFRRKTKLEWLGKFARARPGLVPSGFIFHMSRCGSTVVSRALASRPDVLVLSEAGPIDAVLRSRLRDPGVTDEQRVDWLRWIVSALGRPQNARQTTYVLKLDAWQTADLALFERAFPGIPWVYIYRDPVEVLISHMRSTSYIMSAANAPALLGMRVTDAIRIPRAEYCARVLSRVGEALLAHGVVAEQLVDYRELPDAVWSRIAPHFGIACTAADIEMMHRSASAHAKRPNFPFEADTEEKRGAAGPEVRDEAAQWLAHIYARLSTIRSSAG